MKKRWTALLLALVMVLTLGASAVSPEEDGADTENAAAEGLAAEEPSAVPTEAGGQGDGDAAQAPPEEAGESQEDAEEPQSDAEEAQSDAQGTLSFGNLRGRMLASYYPMLALQESIDDIEGRNYDRRSDDLREKLNSIAMYQSALVSASPLAMETSAYASLQTQYDRMRVEFDAIRDGEKQKEDADALRQYRNAQDQAAVAGEALFIALKSMMAQSAALTRQITQLDRTVQEMELRCDLGQISRLAAEQVKAGRTQAISGQKTLEMNIEVYLLQLKSMVGVGLDEPLALGALPKVTAAQLDAMQLEADLETAKARSYDLYDAKKQLDDFKENTYDEVIKAFGSDESIFEVSQAKHALRAYQYNYENTLLTYELNFRTLYAQIKDCAQTLDAKRAALAAQEGSYAVSALRFEQGNISANALADAKDELAAAKDEVANAERELFSKYRSYQWAVEYGILNG